MLTSTLRVYCLVLFNLNILLCSCGSCNDFNILIMRSETCLGFQLDLVSRVVVLLFMSFILEKLQTLFIWQSTRDSQMGKLPLKLLSRLTCLWEISNLLLSFKKYPLICVWLKLSVLDVCVNTLSFPSVLIIAKINNRFKLGQKSRLKIKTGKWLL